MRYVRGPLTQLNCPTLLRSDAYINGEWVQAKTGKTQKVISA